MTSFESIPIQTAGRNTVKTMNYILDLHKFLYVSNLTFIQKQAFNVLSQTDIEISWVYEMDTFHDPLTNYCAVTTIGAFYIC